MDSEKRDDGYRVVEKISKLSDVGWVFLKSANIDLSRVMKLGDVSW
jgi:hypothetical protein